MTDYLLVKRLKIENANMVAGLTWGFPAVSQFLGFTHALDRKLRQDDLSVPVLLGGCAVICHKHQPHSKADNYGSHHFSLTRNPLTKEGNTAPFNEEGRMHLEVSLLIEMNMTLDAFYEKLGREDILDEQNQEPFFLSSIERALGTSRVAGGVCVGHDSCEVIKLEGDSIETRRKTKRVLFNLLPGFALIDRSDLLQVHHEALIEHNNQASFIGAWMDFGGLRHRYFQSPEQETNEDSDEPAKGEWQRVELPEQGWFVPILTGYQPIAPLQAPGSVKGSRDSSCPSCAVEGVYGVGQWLAPYRAEQIDTLIWRYRNDEHGYHFYNAGRSNGQENSEVAES